ncbi:Dihydrolipoamide acetyltransferase component of pyruvate dehydrogenase complex [Streptomyces graminofaciens]|uniref:Dihydrolipoamide acetyltransferase component of pyruvate dehydrogenase complex n=1 Tax=Streptomyces graminofaciens TaxID=68212 RepID=A0ABM7F3P2_9ACTN|nr:2-oxo acid dehydrogenase subunit E2 [Streptomyces graminofaciens]BBC30373.1 Dihydrolipoamide acetyltransferase component of pyruvate dehydrogenase complex [Streptomyces graminofaciens]
MTDVAVEVLLPKIGLTMQEGTIDEWLVATGAAVEEGDALLRLATDKVDVDVEAEAGGLFHPVVPAGATLPAGALIGWLLAEGEQPPDPVGTPMPAGSGTSGTAAAPAVSGAASAPTASVAPSLNGSSATGGTGNRLLVSPNARRVASEGGVDLTLVRGTGPGGRIVSEDVEEFLADAEASPAAQASPAVLPADPVLPVSPLVRRLAKERGIELSQVNGTGPGGRIRRSDLDSVTPAPAPAPVRRNTAPRPGDVLPLTGMRGTIARRMHASLQEMAQLTHGYEVRMDAVVALRNRLKEEWADSELPVPSLNDFLLKAAASALREHPLLNATVREDGVHLLDDIHLGFAVAVPGGLMVPVIEDAVALPLPEIARRSRALAQAAREGRVSPAQLEGATFTVTSLGGYGVDFFTPVINPGNVAILGVGRLRDGVEWRDDRPLRTRVLTLSLTFDHRAVDGAPAAEYLRTVGELLRKPLRLLM